MKGKIKFVLVILISLISISVANAQRMQRYRGFFGTSYIHDVSGEIEENRWSLWTSHGCQFNPYLYAGVGASAIYWEGINKWNVPVFAHVRGELRKKISPYFDMKIGYSFDDLEGLYFTPQIGLHFYFGDSKTGISIGLGYTHQNFNVDSYKTYFDEGSGSIYDVYDGKNSLKTGGLEFIVAIDI